SEWIRAWGKGLYGLVNNAGIGGFGPMVDTSVEELHLVLDSNLYGMHRMVRACFPFLLESHGRIVNICSIAGILTESFRGTYGISKHAAESYTDLLREELSGLGIHVSAIEPGSFRSNIMSNGLARMGPDAAATWKNSVYRDVVDRAIAQLTSSPEHLAGLHLPEPRPVAEAVADALFSDRPKPRYLVANQEETDRVIAQVLTLLSQLNQKQDHTLTKAQLAERLQAIVP
ncbi:MAG: SDR family NAD(P)-dependent oxidoreductase, partial [Thermoplasmata archaeon]